MASVNSGIAEKAKNAADAVKTAIKGGKAGIVSIVVQVLVGIIATYLLYIVVLKVMQSDKVIIDEKFGSAKKRSVRIIDGFVDASMKGVQFNTDVSFASNYVPIKPSMNIKGGAQYSYNMWLYIGSGATDDNVAHKALFLKGSASGYNFTVKDNKTNSEKIMNKERMVYCPMFKFGNNTKSFEVLFNTLDKYDEKLVIDSVSAQDSIYRNNLLSTLTNTWVMITITFEDNIPINEFENGVVVKFFVNDTLYKVGRFASALKQNYGDLHLFPNASPISDVKISNMSYYNYVLSDAEIRALAAGGANTASSSVYMPPMAAKPPTLSDYNKLDIYNA